MRLEPTSVIVAVVAVIGSIAGGWITALAGPTSPVGECRTQSLGERPNDTTNDIANCVFQEMGTPRVRVTVQYTSTLGTQNLWIGLDVLKDDKRLPYFGYRPAPISPGRGEASVEIIYGLNNAPSKLMTDRLDLFMYIGGGSIFYRKQFNFRHNWQR